MLNISKDSVQFDLQARTDLATTANGTSINATIFSAFVAKDQTGSKLQTEMSRDKTSTVLFYLQHTNPKQFSHYFKTNKKLYCITTINTDHLEEIIRMLNNSVTLHIFLFLKKKDVSKFSLN